MESWWPGSSASRFHTIGFSACTADGFASPASSGMSIFKIGIMLFNLVPLVALSILG
jgi:hypothetical protein